MWKRTRKAHWFCSPSDRATARHSMQGHILIVEDEEAIAAFVQTALERGGFSARRAKLRLAQRRSACAASPVKARRLRSGCPWPSRDDPAGRLYAAAKCLHSCYLAVTCPQSECARILSEVTHARPDRKNTRTLSHRQPNRPGRHGDRLQSLPALDGSLRRAQSAFHASHPRPGVHQTL